MKNREFYPIKVKETRTEIGGLAKSITFDVPESLQEVFRWRAGQHVTLKLFIDGKESRRSYSISSPPLSNANLRITVKRVKSGLVSNHINDNIEKGDTIELMSPSGDFYLDTNAMARRTYYFFGAGSGITPLFSMISSVLHMEPYSAVNLIYGSRNFKSVLLKEELEQLQKFYPKRFSISHILSSPSMWSSFRPWRKGRIDEKAIVDFITENPPYAQDCQYYVCGPDKMNETVRHSLLELDVPSSRIHVESYGTGKPQVDKHAKEVVADVLINLNGEQYTLKSSAGQTLLEAAKLAGLEPPYSCQSGVCGLCKAYLKKGEVHMPISSALEQSEIEAGEILTCQAIAQTNKLEICYK